MIAWTSAWHKMRAPRGRCVTDLFLSYKAEDRARVVPLVQALETDGFSVWWDAHIGGGDDWRGTILRHLEAARCVVVVWSRRSVGPDGEFVRDEASRAKRRGTYLPIRIDKVDPPLGFGETQALDLRSWKGDRSHPRYKALLAALHGRVGVPQQGRAIPPPRGISRRGAIIGGSAAAAAAAAGGAWLLLRPAQASTESIAVLPFANLSGDPNQAYFSDGIAEELRTALAQIPDLKVVARTSSEAVRDADAHTAASKLRVDNILTGSVRRSPAMLRISAQLIDGSKGTERWSEVYDRPVGDALQIQEEIASQVAQSLSIHLGAAEQRVLKEGATRNAQAQDLLLQAKNIVWRSDDRPSIQRATELVDRALTLDPAYADALTAKAAMLNFLGANLATSVKDAQTKMGVAEDLARRAIKIAPRSAFAHAALADNLWSRLRLRAAMKEFEAAGKLPGADKNFFNGFDPYAMALACCRRFDEANLRADQLVAADPLNPYAYATKGLIYAHSHRYPEGHEAMSQAAALGPDLRWPRAFQAYLLMQMGRLDEARKGFEAVREVGPWTALAAILATRQGDHAEADRLVGLMHRELGDAAYYQYAEVFAQQGKVDEAIAALTKGLAVRDPGMPFLLIDPMVDPLRNDPRFQAIIKRLDFPT